MLWCWSRVSRALQTLKFHYSFWSAETLCKVSPSQLLQWCHWWWQRNTAVSPVKLFRTLPEQGRLTISCFDVKPRNDLWPSSFLLPQPKTTPLPLVINPFKAVVRFNISCFGVLCVFWRLFHVFLPADYHRLRVGGLILAAVLCLIGIMILLSKMEKAHARAHMMLPFL